RAAEPRSRAGPRVARTQGGLPRARARAVVGRMDLPRRRSARKDPARWHRTDPRWSARTDPGRRPQMDPEHRAGRVARGRAMPPRPWRTDRRTACPEAPPLASEGSPLAWGAPLLAWGAQPPASEGLRRAKAARRRIWRATPRS